MKSFWGIYLFKKGLPLSIIAACLIGCYHLFTTIPSPKKASSSESSEDRDSAQKAYREASNTAYGQNDGKTSTQVTKTATSIYLNGKEKKYEREVKKEEDFWGIRIIIDQRESGEKDKRHEFYIPKIDAQKWKNEIGLVALMSFVASILGYNSLKGTSFSLQNLLIHAIIGGVTSTLVTFLYHHIVWTPESPPLPERFAQLLGEEEEAFEVLVQKIQESFDSL